MQIDITGVVNAASILTSIAAFWALYRVHYIKKQMKVFHPEIDDGWK